MPKQGRRHAGWRSQPSRTAPTANPHHWKLPSISRRWPTRTWARRITGSRRQGTPAAGRSSPSRTMQSKGLRFGSCSKAERLPAVSSWYSTGKAEPARGAGPFPGFIAPVRRHRGRWPSARIGASFFISSSTREPVRWSGVFAAMRMACSRWPSPQIPAGSRREAAMAWRCSGRSPAWSGNVQSRTAGA